MEERRNGEKTKRKLVDMEANIKLKVRRSNDDGDGGDANDDDLKEVDLSVALSWLGNLVNNIDNNAPPLETPPKRKLLVLGLDGLLCEPVLKRGNTFRTFWGWFVNGQNPSRTVYPNCPNESGHESFSVYKRPHCQEFLKFCLERFDVAIWSTAERWYTDNALDCVMNGLKISDLLFVWNQEECKDSGLQTLKNGVDESILMKELNKVFQKRWGTENIQYSASNTLMIDSEPYRALLNPPNNAVFPPEYKFENVDDNVLGGDLLMFLNGLVGADDVPSYVKAHQYGQPAITESNPNWADYRNIILAHGGSN